MTGLVYRPTELSAREKDVLDLIYKGKTNLEIGRALFIEENTVKLHATNIYKKLGVKGRMGLVQLRFKELEKQNLINNGASL